MHSWNAAGRRGSVAVLILGLTLTGCSTSGTIKGTAKPSGSRTSSGGASGTGGPTTGHSVASGSQGSPSASSAPPNTTVTKDEGAAALKAYQDSYNAADAALNTAALAKAESGSLLVTDQAGILDAIGVGGDKEKQTKQPIALTNPAFFFVASTSYPRGFFVTADVVQPGAANSSWLMHFNQDHAGGPWLADRGFILSSGQQWPAFAVGPDGLLDSAATRQDKLALSTTDLAAADRTMLADGNAGQAGSPFVNDDVTTTELRWIQAESDDVSPAGAALTVTTDLSPLPTSIPLEDGGELVLFATRISLRVSQSGRTFTFGDPGWIKIAGTDHFDGGFTVDMVYLTAAIDPPDKAAKIQKIAQSGGMASVH
jgi:hypothetical protein